MAKILVTGASGFIGSHLAQALVARGDEVACLVRKTSKLDRLRPLGVRLVYGDVTDPQSLGPAIGDAEVVYHVAGCHLVLHVEQYYRVNEQGVRNVARACAQRSTPPVLVSVSSLAAAGPAAHGRARTEADPPVPVSNYGRSKQAGEQAAREFAGRVPITIVRPSIVLGEADPVTLSMFKMIARCGVHFVPALGRSRFSVIHAADLAEMLIAAAGRGNRLPAGGQDAAAASQGIYFAACEEHPTYAGLGRMIGTALGRRRVLVFPTPPRTVWVVAAVSHVISRIIRQPLYVNFDRVREIRAGSWLCCPQRALDELGFSVTTPLAERLRQAADWYRRQGWL